MKKSHIIAIILIAVIILGTGVAYGAGQIARSNAITENDAINFACVDAGLSPEDISVTELEFDFSYGRFVYEIEFISNGIEYSYVVDSQNGEILDKGYESKNGILPDGFNQGNNQNSNAGSSSGGSASSSSSSSGTAKTEPATISVDKAKSIALSYAGVSASSAVFEKAKMEKDNGTMIYDIEFYVPGQREYDLEIDAYSGAVLEYDYENLYVPSSSSGSSQASSGTTSAGSISSSSNVSSGSSAYSSSSVGSSATYYDYDDDDDDYDDYDDDDYDYDDRDDDDDYDDDDYDDRDDDDDDDDDDD